MKTFPINYAAAEWTHLATATSGHFKVIQHMAEGTIRGKPIVQTCIRIALPDPYEEGEVEWHGVHADCTPVDETQNFAADPVAFQQWLDTNDWRTDLANYLLYDAIEKTYRDVTAS